MESPTQPAQQNKFQHTEVNGRFNKYTSGYWALALPALSVRYAFEAMANIATKITKSKAPLKEVGEKFERGYAIGVGSFMMGVTALYAYRTYKDMRNLFAEPLAWEFDKKPEDIGFMDIMKSENVLVKDLRHRFLSYNMRRTAVNSVFFSLFLPKTIAPSPDEAVKLGVASNALYLMTDVLGRNETFFERLQGFIDNKINHVDKVGDKITATDLMNLSYLHERDLNPQFVAPQMNSEQWHTDEVFFGRMADLMNQTYGNSEVNGQANFTITKFMYLMGMGLMNSGHRERDTAYLELANSQGIPATKQAALSHAPINLAMRGMPEAESILPEKKFALQTRSNPLQATLAEKPDAKSQHASKTAPGSFTEKLATESHDLTPHL